MLYHSTRDIRLTAAPARAVLEGIAPDGGLYICDPARLGFDWQGALRLDTLSMAAKILSALLPDFPDMEDIVRKSYAGKFPTADLTPLVPVGDKYVLELYHGPTSAFKDVALSVLPRLIGAAARAQGMTGDVVILTATSGDTGKAALEGFHDVKGTRIIVFYPYGGVSAVQQAQMATQTGDNVKVCAVRGNFDDAQTGVKQVFAACKGRDLHGAVLSSANSINIGRLAPQVVYYKTTSPSMDILVSSNLERLLFLLSRDPAYVASLMRQLNEDGAYQLSGELLAQLQRDFSCGCCDDAGASEVIGRLWRDHRYLCDPHTAVAWSVAEQCAAALHDTGAPTVVLSTASPYKFPAAVLAALGQEGGENEFCMMNELSRISGVPIPPNLAGLEGRPVLHKDVIDKDAMLDYVLAEVLKK